ALRAYSWGIVLGPVFVMTAGAMLPHSWTMLLEGEGYILAAFFAVLVPVYLFAPAGRNSEAGNAASGDVSGDVPALPKAAPVALRDRFRRAVVLNLQGAVWVALILAVAAVYEATELILLAG